MSIWPIVTKTTWLYKHMYAKKEAFLVSLVSLIVIYGEISNKTSYKIGIYFANSFQNLQLSFNFLFKVMYFTL